MYITFIGLQFLGMLKNNQKENYGNSEGSGSV